MLSYLQGDMMMAKNYSASLTWPWWKSNSSGIRNDSVIECPSTGKWLRETKSDRKATKLRVRATSLRLKATNSSSNRKSTIHEYMNNALHIILHKLYCFFRVLCSNTFNVCTKCCKLLVEVHITAI